MNNDEIDAAVAELWNRRTEAFGNVDPALYSGVRHPGLEAMEDATTDADVRMLNAARNSLDERSKSILALYVNVWRSFGKQRCSVCGRTKNQNAEIRYDCAREC